MSKGKPHICFSNKRTHTFEPLLQPSPNFHLFLLSHKLSQPPFIPSPKASTYQLVLHDKVDEARENDNEANQGRHRLAVKLERLLRNLTPSVPLLRVHV